MSSEHAGSQTFQHHQQLQQQEEERQSQTGWGRGGGDEEEGEGEGKGEFAERESFDSGIHEGYTDTSLHTNSTTEMTHL